MFDIPILIVTVLTLVFTVYLFWIAKMQNTAELIRTTDVEYKRNVHESVYTTYVENVSPCLARDVRVTIRGSDGATIYDRTYGGVHPKMRIPIMSEIIHHGMGVDYLGSTNVEFKDYGYDGTERVVVTYTDALHTPFLPISQRRELRRLEFSLDDGNRTWSGNSK